MEKIKINSKKGYNRSRVISGYGPHRMLEKIHKEMLAKIAKEETQEKDSDSD